MSRWRSLRARLGALTLLSDLPDPLVTASFELNADNEGYGFAREPHQNFQFHAH